MINVAFCNDCDRMTWDNYLKIHGILDELSLPAGDSFWLFDPMGISEMSLFRNDVGHKTANHYRLLEHIKSGSIDVLHGIGLFGKTNDDYVYPSRNEICRAFEYLAKHGCKIRVYVCHGNAKHRHNIPAGPDTRRYQSGDLPYSSFYILDIVQKYGIEYFWISELQKDLKRPFRLLRPATMPSGEHIPTFSRFGEWGTGCHNIPSMLNKHVLGRALAMKQNLVFFTHWGMKGVYSPTPGKPLLHRDVISAFTLLSKLQAESKIRVMRLPELLEQESTKTLADEVDRVSNLLPGGEMRHPSSEYARLTDEIGLAGRTALDATGEGGSFAVHLAERFERVVCLDENEEHLARAHYLAGTLNLPRLTFHKGILARTSFAADTADAVFLRASGLDAAGETIRQAYRALAAGRSMIIFADSNLCTPQTLETVCREAGFRTLEWKPASLSGNENGQGAFIGNLPRFFACK